ncbi:MAG: class II fructose-bisphosphate aldolase [Nitrospiraceae bacterium]|nr:class II fructose-bisphosphate aldolase [Nitrospiraceae bacterium]
MKRFSDVVEANGAVKLKDRAAFIENLDSFLYAAVFEPDAARKTALLTAIKEAAKQEGVIPCSIHDFYMAMGGDYAGITVPAINVRGLTYDVSRAIFRKALEHRVGAFIFEIARSEIGYTKQRPLEYSTVVAAAALKEGYKGPVFIQGDHFQFSLKNYQKGKEAETEYIRGLVKEAIDAEFYNIDIDASTLVDLSKPAVSEQQRPNFEHTAMLAGFIRENEPKGITVSIGGEIGEIGGKNSTPDELSAYLEGFNASFKGEKGLSKLSVQTGTSHGGVVLPDGTLAKVKIDFDTLKVLSDMARKKYGLGGCVQHGASTLPEEAFDMFPKTGTVEVHLATGFQNIIYDSSHLPDEFRREAYQFIKTEYAGEKKESETEDQFIYKTRKKGFGPLKQKWWDLPAATRGEIMKEIEQKFELLFEKLKVKDTRALVDRHIKPLPVKKEVYL